MQLLLTDRHCEPGLARSTHRGDGQQSVIQQELPGTADLVVSADQPGGPDREIRRVRIRHPERWELPVTDLEQPDRFGDVPERVDAELGRLDAGDGAHGLGQEDLSSVRGGFDPGRRVDRRPEVVTVTFVGLAEMQSHPHPQWRAGPRHGRELALRRLSGVDRVGGTGECRGKRVTGGGEHVPLPRFDGLTQDGVVPLEGGRHAVVILRPQPGRAFDVGEQERHCPRGKLRHARDSTAVAAGPQSLVATGSIRTPSGDRPPGIRVVRLPGRGEVRACARR